MNTQVSPRTFLFVLWEGGGNVPPQLGLARRLAERGHRVRVISDPCNAEEVEAVGCTFIAYTRAPRRNDKTAQSTIIKDYEAKNPAAAFAMLRERLMFGPALAYAEDVLAELEREPADAVCVSEGIFGGMIAAEKTGIPYAVTIPSYYPFPAPGLPPIGTGFLPATGLPGHLRDALFNTMITRAVARGLPALNAARTSIGLNPIKHPLEQMNRAQRVLMLTSQAFDFPAGSLPSNVRYVGPVMDDPAWTQPWVSPWPNNHPDPLVVVGFSTTFQDQGTILQKILDALDGLPARGLVTLGPALDGRDFRAPANVVIQQSAPHAQIFPLASAVVTHAGHGTVIRALACGVPLVCLPMGRDQAGNASRVVARGAGLSLKRYADVSTIRQAIRRVVEEPDFRLSARRLSERVMEEADKSTAVQELEQLAADTRAILNPTA